MTQPRQLSLPLPPPPADADTPLVPARMVNEWVYCPRLIAKMDVVETGDGMAMPVDFKKGKRPHVAGGAYEPERVQLCVQAMILEDNGYKVEQAALWYVGSRERVGIVLDEELRARTLEAITGLRSSAASGRRPPPLEDSPKCPRCSLAGICLPDETNLFRKGSSPRPLNPSDDPALPLYVQTPGARLRKSGDRLMVETEGETVEVPLIDVSQVSLFGPVSVTTPALHALMRAEIPVSWFSTGGWFLGHTTGTGHGNVAVREAQYQAAFDKRRRLVFARDLVAAKVRNARTLLRRNWRVDGDSAEKTETLVRLKGVARRVPRAENDQQLLGLEGEAAAVYFGVFENMLATGAKEDLGGFSFEGRNRRPPTDPVNAALGRSSRATLCSTARRVPSSPMAARLSSRPSSAGWSRRPPTPSSDTASPCAGSSRCRPGCSRATCRARSSPIRTIFPGSRHGHGAPLHRRLRHIPTETLAPRVQDDERLWTLGAVVGLPVPADGPAPRRDGRPAG